MFYHGTSNSFKSGELIVPAKESGVMSEKGRKRNVDKVFFTKDLGSAWIYAGRAANSLGGIPRVYEVEPIGKMDILNDSKGTTVYMSDSARVISDIPKGAGTVASRLSKRADEFDRMPSADELVRLADMALVKVKEKLEEKKYSKEVCMWAQNMLSAIGGDLDVFVENGGGIEAQKTFWPINKKMADLTIDITSKLLDEEGIDGWYEFLRYRILHFIKMWSVENVKQALVEGNTDTALLVRNVMSAVELLKNEISTYEKKFGSTFDPSLSQKLDKHIHALEKEFKLFLGEDKISTEKPLKIETVDSDKLLDLYQEIAKMPLDDPSRLDKIREFERLQRIIKGDTEMKKVIRAYSREFRKESLKNMDQLERPVVQRPQFPVFKPDTETGIANDFNAPKFSPEKKDLFEHKDPTQVLSDYDLLDSVGKLPENKRDPRIVRLKYLQNAHTMLLNKMFQELGQKLAHKEISDRFWDTLPADIRSRYKDKIASIRKNIRAIYEQFPQHFEQYKNQNKPYFRKQEQKKASRIVVSYVRKMGDKWCVLSHKGKKLGCYDSKAAANKRLRQIEYFKHKG